MPGPGTEQTAGLIAQPVTPHSVYCLLRRFLHTYVLGRVDAGRAQSRSRYDLAPRIRQVTPSCRMGRSAEGDPAGL
jgi:hypothetical protein